MAKISMTIATLDDAYELALLMREDDKAEVRAFPGVEPLDAVLDSIRFSEHAWALRCEDDLLAMWGVARGEVPGNMRLVWLLSSRHVDRHRKSFMRACQAGLEAMRGQYGTVANMVDARYVRSIAWAARLGFNVGKAVPLGLRGEMFHTIYKNMEA